MKDYTASLYSSKAWQKTREAYKRSVGGLCEVCWAKGVVKPGEIVHHKIHLTPENINDPEISLNHEHLEYQCKPCHQLKIKGGIQGWRNEKAGNICDPQGVQASE